MDLNSSACLDMLPGLFEVLLHLGPDFQLVSAEVPELLAGLALELVQAVSSLNDCSFLH